MIDNNKLLMIVFAFVVGYMASGMIRQMCGGRLVEGIFGTDVNFTESEDGCRHSWQNQCNQGCGSTLSKTNPYEDDEYKCKKCLKGYYNNSVGEKDPCIVCGPNSTTANIGSTNANDCVCKPGYYKSGADSLGRAQCKQQIGLYAKCDPNIENQCGKIGEIDKKRDLVCTAYTGQEYGTYGKKMVFHQCNET